MLARLQQLWVKINIERLSDDFRKGSVSIVKLACLIRCFREYGVDLTLVCNLL